MDTLSELELDPARHGRQRRRRRGATASRLTGLGIIRHQTSPMPSPPSHPPLRTPNAFSEGQAQDAFTQSCDIGLTNDGHAPA